VYAGLDDDGRFIHREPARVEPCPQLVGPAQRVHIGGLQGKPVGAYQAQPAEVRRVRVAEHPPVEFPMARGVLHGSGDGPALDGPRDRDVVGREALGQWLAVPGPVSHSIAAEGLEARAVHAHTELAVAERHLARRLIPPDVVSAYQGVAVDAGLLLPSGGAPGAQCHYGQGRH